MGKKQGKKSVKDTGVSHVKSKKLQKTSSRTGKRINTTKKSQTASFRERVGIFVITACLTFAIVLYKNNDYMYSQLGPVGVRTDNSDVSDTLSHMMSEDFQQTIIRKAAEAIKTRENKYKANPAELTNPQKSPQLPESYKFNEEQQQQPSQQQTPNFEQSPSDPESPQNGGGSFNTQFDEYAEEERIQENDDIDDPTDDQLARLQKLQAASSYAPKNEKLHDQFDFYAPVPVEMKALDYSRLLPNPDFFFHNKLPKSGSSTMNQLLNQLRKHNTFSYLKMWPSEIPGDAFDKETPFMMHFRKVIQNITVKPLVLLKHHFPFDFTQHGIKNPTYINVIRHPADWFQSHFYFERYGWERKQEKRTDDIKKTEDMHMTVDECVQKRHTACTQPVWKYVEFFCGNHRSCKDRGKIDQQKRVALEMAKKNVANMFYVVGVLEQFEDTLKLFERMIPAVYDGVLNIYKTPLMQMKRQSTKTVNVTYMNEESRQYFINGPLKYDYDLYTYVRQLFNERLKRHGIERKIKT